MSKLPLSPLHLSNFRPLLLTHVFTTMTLQAQAVILGWQIYSLTKSTLMLGLAGLAEALPAFAGAIVAGHVVDTGSPLSIYRICLLTLLGNTAVFLLFGGNFLPAPGGNVVPWLFGGIFVSGLARSFAMPASFALTAQIVPKSVFSAALAWLAGGFEVASIGGPAMAGLIYGGYGARAAWQFSAPLIATASILACYIRPPSHTVSSEAKEPALKSIRTGWRFILGHPVLLSVMLLDMFAVLLGGATAMLPAYADRILHVGSEGLGALRVAPAVGSILMASFLAARPFRTLSARRLLVAVFGFGLSMIGFGLSTSFPFSLLMLALSGAFDNISVVIRGTLMQALTPDNMRGRVSSIATIFVISSNEIGAFESGMAAQLLGLVPSVVVGGIGTLIVVVLIGLLSPKFRKTVIEA